MVIAVVAAVVVVGGTEVTCVAVGSRSMIRYEWYYDNIIMFLYGHVQLGNSTCVIHKEILNTQVIRTYTHTS